MNALVKYKQQFGIETVVPACPVSALFSEIAGTATLTRRTIGAMKELGVKIEVVQEQRSI